MASDSGTQGDNITNIVNPILSIGTAEASPTRVFLKRNGAIVPNTGNPSNPRLGPGSIQDGTQPTRVIAVRLTWPDGDEGARAGDPQISLWRSSMINGAGAPLRLAMIHGRATESGTTIRMPPEKTTVQFGSVERSLLGLGETKGGPAAIDQTDATGEGGRLLDLPFVLSQGRYTFDNARILGAAVREANGAREFGVALIDVERPARARFFPIGPGAAEDWKAPFATGEVDVQP